MENSSFYRDFFWESMVFEGMRFQYIDTLPLNSDRLSGPSGMSIFVMITFLPLDSVIASNIKLIVL